MERGYTFKVAPDDTVLNDLLASYHSQMAASQCYMWHLSDSMCSFKELLFAIKT